MDDNFLGTTISGTISLLSQSENPFLKIVFLFELLEMVILGQSLDSVGFETVFIWIEFTSLSHDLLHPNPEPVGCWGWPKHMDEFTCPWAEGLTSASFCAWWSPRSKQVARLSFFPPMKHMLLGYILALSPWFLGCRRVLSQGWVTADASVSHGRYSCMV